MKYYNSRKLYSVLISLLIVISIIFSSTFSSVSYGIEGDNAEDIFRGLLEDSRKEEGTLVEEDSPKLDDIVTFIVELNEKSGKDLSKGLSLDKVAQDKVISRKVVDSQDYYKQEIRKINENAIFSNQYTLLLNGFSVETRYGDKAEISEIRGIKNITLAKTYHKDMKNAVHLTDVSKIWDEYGYDGRGKVVSVLDSGVDYNHKDMVISPGVDIRLTEYKVNEIKDNQIEKKGRYFTEKVPFGYNYADKDDNIVDTVKSNIDYGHGMHVTGIIGANCQSEDEIKQNNGLKGVAPEVQILAMKIFSNDPRKLGASEADIITAIEDSVSYGADIINMSFCLTSGFEDSNDGQQVAIRAAIEQGLIVVGAAGNVGYSTYPTKHEGNIDTGTIGSPGLAPETIQVASFENSSRVTFGLNATINGKVHLIPYVLSDFNPESLKSEYNLVDCNLGRDVDLKDIDLRNKIALIKRGEIEFKDKKLNAQKKGALGVIIYNADGDEGYLDYISTDESVKIPTIFTNNSNGIKLKEMISENLKVSFKGEKVQVPSVENGTMSYFTSWGPTPNLNLKPDITSVGGTIWSTVNDHGYKNMSGTSMSTPHTAGIAALALEHIDKTKIHFSSLKERSNYVKNILMNTAEVKIDEISNLPYSPRRQGAGLINAKDALQNQVFLTYKGLSSISLKEIEKNTIVPLTLENTSDKDISYKVELVGGVLTEQNKTINTMSYDVLLEGAKFEFENEEIIVKSGETLNVNGYLSLDDNTPQNIFVEGFIRFTPLSGDTIPSIGIPFMGFYGGWDELEIIDKPSYDEQSILKQTSLFTAEIGPFLTRTYPLGGKNMNPEYFAINPDDAKSNNNVLPQFSMLRNAKEIKIDITNENGKIIKEIEDRENLRKEIFIEQQIYSKVNFEWLWKGSIYDKELGIQRSVDEGQYYLNIRSKIDFENAKEQVVTFPLKIDKTPPTIKSYVSMSGSNECIVEMEVGDKGIVDSGIEHFLFLLDGKKYEDEKGNYIFDLVKENDGKYRMKIQLPEENKKPSYTIDIGVTDHAGNMRVERIKLLREDKVEDEELIIKNMTDIKSLNNGEDVLGKVKVINNSNKSKELILTLGLYDEYNRLVNFSAVEKNIKPGKEGTLTSSLMVPDTGIYKLKIFIWDSLDSMKPLSKMMEINQ